MELHAPRGLANAVRLMRIALAGRQPRGFRRQTQHGLCVAGVGSEPRRQAREEPVAPRRVTQFNIDCAEFAASRVGADITA